VPGTTQRADEAQLRLARRSFADVSDHIEEHYAQVATSYNSSWSNRAEYVSWMNSAIEKRLRISSGDRIADIGAGTGLFLRQLAPKASVDEPILCIDPSAEMLENLPEDPRLRPIRGTAEDVAAGQVALPYEQLDAIVMKEVIHHVTDVSSTLRGLAGLMAPDGRMLVVTLPPLLEYPLFQAALDRFAAMQPEPERVANAMQAAGLQTECQIEEVPVVVDRDQYIDLVGNRWMSVLSTFTDEELTAGLDEMRERYLPGELQFVDRFAFVTGVR
jgi:2-polyprenyl-3-methyl-5-hydroxy-6-metoxy-1,4-benzoquinol methylase